VSHRVLLLLQSLALALLACWPVLTDPVGSAVGSPESDTIKHLWTLWWMRAQLLAGGGLHTTMVNYPDGMTLFPIEPLNGLLAVLLPRDPVLTSNLLAVLHLTLTGVCAGWLGRLTSGTDRGALACAALFQGSAFVAFTLHVGVGELRQAWWLPLGLGCLVRAHQLRTPRWFLTLALVLAGAALACFYHGLFLATAVSVWALVTLRPSRKLLGGYAAAAALSLLIVLPVVSSFSSSFGKGPARQVMGARGEVLIDYRVEAAHLDDLVRWRSPDPDPAARQERAYGGGRYLGLVALLLAAAGLVAAPGRAYPWVVMAGTGTVLGLGSVLWLDGERVLRDGHALRLPLAWLNQALVEHAEPIHFPARFLALAALGVSVLGGLALRWRWLGWLVPVALIDIAMHDLAVWPRRVTTLPDMRGLDPDALAALGVTGPLADLALAAESNEETRTLAVAAQIAAGLPTQGVPIERLDGWAPEGTAWLRTRPIHALGNLARPGVTVPSAEALAEDLAALRARGFAGVLITHREPNIDPRTRALLTPLCGEPLRALHATVWKLPEG
jgi:hypothetical protein